MSEFIIRCFTLDFVLLFQWLNSSTLYIIRFSAASFGQYWFSQKQCQKPISIIKPSRSQHLIYIYQKEMFTFDGAVLLVLSKPILLFVSPALIISFIKALRLRPNCVACLIRRSKCFMLIARPQEGMNDIKAALALDPESYKVMVWQTLMLLKALLQIAEILYQSTAFESALVYFHRGKKIRPASNDFVLGVTKSEAAISNVIGGRK